MGKGYLYIDPVIKYCRETHKPFYWDSSQESHCEDKKVKEFWLDVAGNGFRSGLSVPLRSPSGLRGIISVVSDRPLTETQINFEKNMQNVSLIGEAMHIGIEKLMRK